MNKAKCKKKTTNKTEPSIVDDEQHSDSEKILPQAQNEETIKSSLSVQIFELSYLNSMKDFNKTLKA